MANKLFSLFEDKLRAPSDLVASPAQNLTSIGQQVEDPQAILRMIQQFEVVRPKADYSDFAKFVFFNSALDYFNLTGEKVLNHYPYDGSSFALQTWLNSLDEYQRYVVKVWPANTGHLKFDPANGFARVLIDDVWKDGEVTRTSLLNASTGSLTVDFWVMPPPALTGSEDAMVLAQKVSGSNLDGYSVYFSGSSLFFAITSGSTTERVAVPSTPGVPTYFCFSYDRSSSPSVVRCFSGSADSFPVLANSLTSSIAGAIDGGTARFLIGSGSVGGKVVRPLTGSLDDVHVWSEPRGLSQLTSSFNARITAQEGLSALWRFNETGSLASGRREVVLDSSGHRLNGNIVGYYSSLRSSGSLIPFDYPDLVLDLEEPAVNAYIAEQQASGTAYDRNNDNIITRLMPEQFFLLEEFKNTTVLQDFLYVIARYFDNLKVMIDQFSHVLKNDYGRTNNTPDALLQDIGRFFGWEFTGNFLNADAVQYILGRQVLPNLDYNRTIDTKLYEIKNEFWKRTLINLMHLYKTKGTRESVESLLRIYGNNTNFIRLKEYGYKPNAGIQTFRIHSEKSVYALQMSGSARVTSKAFVGSLQTVETRVRFPTTTTTEMVATQQSGSIWWLNSGSITVRQLTFEKTSISSLTGNLVYSGSEGRLELNAPIFDNEWYNVAVLMDQMSGSVRIDVRSIDQDEVDFSQTASLAATISTASLPATFFLGNSGTLSASMWTQETRAWDQVLSDTELEDHTLNFQSYGTEESDGLPSLSFHWRLNDNLEANGSGYIGDGAYDFTSRGISGSISGVTPDESPFVKFLNDFNYIASPEYGWNEEKVRSLATSVVKPADAFRDSTLVALEFNLVDALNEDISQIISTLDTFNEFVGAPVNTYRDSYIDLDLLRRNYFERLQGSVNFRLFADMLEFFDRSFVDMVRKLIPARATFLGDEFVVESHMLERPKVQWNYRRREVPFEPEGRIQIYIRT